MDKWLKGLVALGILLAVFESVAADFPNKPIRVIVPFPPGGGLDTVIRIIEPDVSKRLGRQLVIENRPGAGGAIGGQLAARSAPDGYTLVMMANTATIDPSYRPKLPYRLQSDFTPITVLASTPYIVVTKPNLPVQNLGELISYAKANPGKLRYGSHGVGTVAHLSAELLKHLAGIDIVHVPYKGAGPSTTAVMSGETEISFQSVQVTSLIEGGKIRALAVTTKERWPSLIKVPPIMDTVPGYEVLVWIGIFAPANTPRDIVNQLHQAFAGSVNSPETAALLLKQGFKGGGNTPTEFARQLESEIAMWSKVIQQANIKPEE